MTHSRPDSLFHEFPAVSREEWKTKAVAELKQTPYESIVWHSPDGFTLEPWYNHEEKANHLNLPLSKTCNSWKNCRRITVQSPEAANLAALRSFELDSAALEFHFTTPELCSALNITRLLKGIECSAVEIYFSGNLPPAAELLETLLSLPGFNENSGGLLTETSPDRVFFERARAIKGFSVLTVDTLPFHEAGSTAAEEIAIALAGVSDHLDHLLQAGIDAESIVAAMRVILPVGSSHFTELGKPRALRHLLGHLLKAYGASGELLPRLFARTSERNHSLLDPYTNLLRLTTEAVSAVLGGYDTLQIGAFDNALSVNDDVAQRITGNIHLILKEEAFLDRVVDPAQGSHYIETLTRKLAESAWSIFKKIEAEGGLEKAIKSGFINTMISEDAGVRQKNIEKRKKTLVGVNRYTWPLTAEQENKITELEQAASALPEGNETARYELLRLKALSYGLKNGRKPSVFIWMVGDPAISFRQAAFAEEFFRVGGFEIIATEALPLEESSYLVALQEKPDIVVLCIAAKDPLPIAETLCTNLSARGTLVVMAGKPPKEPETLFSAGLDSFIYTGVNVLEMLDNYQHKTGVQ